MRVLAGLLAVVALAGTSVSYAQGDNEEAAAEARRIFVEGRAHEEARRYALAAERYQEAHDIMRRAALERAAVALYWAGRALSHVPGRERDARSAFQGFIDSSTLLTEDEQVRDWRSAALEQIAELDARIGPEPESPEAPEGADLDSPTSDIPQETERNQDRDGGGLSPVGPVLMGVGGGAVIAGLVMVGVAYVQNQDQAGRCPDFVGCDPAMREEADSTLALGLAGDVVWVAGGAVAIAGLVLTLVLEEEGEERARSELLLQGRLAGGLAAVRWRFQ